jgi:hypothetical protein
MNTFKNYISYSIIGASIIIAAYLFANAYKYKFKNDETITVTGLAEKNFTSDLIVWRGDFSRKAFSLKEVYASIKEDENKIKNYLKESGIMNTEIVFSSINILKEFDENFDSKGNTTGRTFSGYNLLSR